MSVTARDDQIEELIEYWARMGIVELGEQYPDEFMTDADVVFRAATETFRYLERVGLLRGDCEFCTPAAARACTDPTCRARGYGQPHDGGDPA